MNINHISENSEVKKKKVKGEKKGSTGVNVGGRRE